MFRRVLPDGTIDGIIDGIAGAKIGETYKTVSELRELSIYPVVEATHDQSKQVLSDYYFDSEKQVVTQKVHDFEKGFALKWKVSKFDENGSLFRPIRIRVKWIDTLTGGVLEQKSNDMIKADSPRFRVDTDGTKNEIGDYVEVYLNYITEQDKQAIEQYCSFTQGAIIQNYNEID
jgi:hypothetical protein